MTAPRFLFAALLFVTAALSARGSTAITFTRDEVAQMALLWETDTIAISPLADGQYPAYGTSTWQYIFPHTNLSSDADIHTDMAVDSAGSGSTGNNTGASPIVCEVINATTSQLNYLHSLGGDRATFRGIFRFYTEHTSERHFELHPVTGLYTWNGSAFVLDTDYHSNVASDPDGTTHTNTTLTNAINGSQTVTAQIEANNSAVDFVFPSPSVNYVQYQGVALSTVTSDATSSYFLFRPDLVPSVTLRCRLIAGTGAANAAAGLTVNQTVTVNALTRTDMGYISSQIASMSAGQTATFPRAVELIVLGLPGFVAPTPTPSPTATPSSTPGGSPASQATNLSTRMRVQTGDAVGIGGFIITGTAPKNILLRAIGPSLSTAGVPNVLADPVLELHGPGSFSTITNDNWKDDPTQKALIEATGIPPSNDFESAIDVTLDPGAYTAVVRGNNNTVGVGLIEVYDLNTNVSSRLANISTRAFVSTGDNIVIAGFILGNHNGADKVVVRGIGPSLTAAGVPDTLANPRLELRDSNGALLVANNDWQDDPAQAQALRDAGLAPTNQLESGVVTTLPPGPYTALFSGVSNGTGNGLVEVYDLGAP